MTVWHWLAIVVGVFGGVAYVGGIASMGFERYLSARTALMLRFGIPTMALPALVLLLLDYITGHRTGSFFPYLMGVIAWAVLSAAATTLAFVFPRRRRRGWMPGEGPDPDAPSLDILRMRVIPARRDDAER